MAMHHKTGPNLGNLGSGQGQKFETIDYGPSDQPSDQLAFLVYARGLGLQDNKTSDK